MFETICNLIPRDPQYPGRGRTLDILKRVLDGKLYEVLPYQFHEERGAGGEYIPLRNRRPSVRYALCRIVVEDSVSLLFSEGHFPTIDCADRAIRALACRYRERNPSQPDDDRGSDTRRHRVCCNCHARAARACFLQRSGHDIPDTGMGPAGARYTAAGNREI